MCSFKIRLALFLFPLIALTQAADKREIYDEAAYLTSPGELNVFPIASPPLHNVLIPKSFYAPRAPTPGEIAAAIVAAKEASAHVMTAQQRVQTAKDYLVSQQRIAAHKEARASLALQQSEAVAAVQRQQASAAANAIVMAQQRLAHAKAEVAEKQRLASEKEGLAANAIHRAATAAGEQLRKSETTAAKVAAIQSSEAAVALKHVMAAKDASLAATAAAVAAASNGYHHGHWLVPASWE